MDNELYHYGVLGMKWGVRRYQNKDGTLTKAGKKRASKEDKLKDRTAKKALKKAYKDDYWKLLEAETLVRDTNINVNATRRLMSETSITNNPAKQQMAKTLNYIAESEFRRAKYNYVEVAQSYVNKYGREKYTKGIVNTKYVSNGRGTVQSLLASDMSYTDAYKYLYG